jgi:hypothetical protein
MVCLGSRNVAHCFKYLIGLESSARAETLQAIVHGNSALATWPRRQDESRPEANKRGLSGLGLSMVYVRASPNVANWVEKREPSLSCCRFCTEPTVEKATKNGAFVISNSGRPRIHKATMAEQWGPVGTMATFTCMARSTHTYMCKWRVLGSCNV